MSSAKIWNHKQYEMYIGIQHVLQDQYIKFQVNRPSETHPVIIHIHSFKVFERLTLSTPCILESCTKIKINLNFYFDTSFWWLQKIPEGL